MIGASARAPGEAARPQAVVDGETRIVAAAVSLTALRLLVAATAANGGLRLTSELAAMLLVAPALVTAFAHAGRGVRAALAAAAGFMALTGSLVFDAPRIVLAGSRDVGALTGVATALAGIVLVGVALRITFGGRRRRVQLLALPVLFAALEWLLVPAVGAGVATSAPRTRPASAVTLHLAGARDVAFAAGDGTRLSGWYVPGTNGGAMILLHGSHGDRSDTTRHLRLLSGLGYAVLAYDARGHGASAGVTNALGWGADADVAAAASFLRRQAGVDPSRIAALGLSMGAEEALRAAADGVALRAVVADGAGASTLGDLRLLDHGLSTPLYVSSTWLTMRGIEAVTGEHEPQPLEQATSRIRVPVLLVASGRTGELEVDRAYRSRLGARARLWYVPDAAHTRALERRPAAYAARVGAFLRSAFH